MTTKVSNTFSVTVGGYSDGDAYTFTGSGFGTKATAAPVLSDQFESGAVGNDLGTPDITPGGAWEVSASASGINPKYYGTGAYGGSQCLRLPFHDGTNTFNTTAEIKTLPSLNSVYVSYYIKVTRVGTDYSRNLKYLRVTGGSGYVQPTVGITQFDADSGGVPISPAMARWYLSNQEITLNDYRPADEGVAGWGDTSTSTSFVEGPITNGGWQRVEQYLDMGTSGNADGTAYCWLDYVVQAGSKNVQVLEAGETTKFVWCTLPYYVAEDYNNGSDWVPHDDIEHEILVDDVYLDSTPQRVEIGDSATFSSCTVREVQRATSWADASVTVTINKGGLSSGTNHVHIVNEDLTTTYVGPVEIS